MENVAQCGSTWREWFAKLNQNGSLWKTRQCSLIEDSEPCFETWPRSGLMLHGACYPLPTLELRTCEKEFGSWPTPCKTDGMIGWSETVVKNREETGLRPSGARIGYQLNYVRQTQPYVTESGLYHPNLSEWLLGWPMTWSDLQPLGTDKYHEWLQQHSPCWLGCF